MRFRDVTRPIRRRWNRLTYDRPLHGVATNFYTALQLTSCDIENLQAELQGGQHSQWYGFIDQVVTVSSGLPIKKLRRNANHAAEYTAVLPVQVSPRGLVAVREELKEALADLENAINDKLFRPPPSRDPSRLSPVAFLSARSSGLSDNKMRQIGVPELWETARAAILAQSPATTQCCFILRAIDFNQCGLYAIASNVTTKKKDKGPPGFVRVEVSMDQLRDFTSKISGMDSLVCDLLIVLDDYRGSPFGAKLNLLRVAQHVKAVSKERSMDRQLVARAIELADDGTGEITLVENVSTETREPSWPVSYIMDFCHSGFSSEHPRKVIHDSQCTFHLFNEGHGVFKPYKRSVKSVSQSGYRVRSCSKSAWTAVVLGLLVPIIYIAVRRWRVPPEEMINTAIALVGLYIAVASPLVYQCCYRGERPGDIFSNVQDVDTQEEFDARGGTRQLADVLQILRMETSAPHFLGGRNMSYIKELRPEMSFDASKPIAFPNLELQGFAICEDEKGLMYMLDKWSYLFEVKLQRVATSLAVARQLEESAPGMDGPNDYERRKTKYTKESHDLTLHSKAVKEDITVAQESGTGCFLVSYKTADDDKHDVIISRLLPFGARPRQIVSTGWRSRVVRTPSWKVLNNDDILGMNIGG